jgi:hypothetical protein
MKSTLLWEKWNRIFCWNEIVGRLYWVYSCGKGRTGFSNLTDQGTPGFLTRSFISSITNALSKPVLKSLYWWRIDYGVNISDSKATGWEIKDRSSVPVRVNCSFFATSRPTKPPCQWLSGGKFQSVKSLKRESDHFPPLNAELKNVWNFTSTALWVYKAPWLGAEIDLPFTLIEMGHLMYGMNLFYWKVRGM